MLERGPIRIGETSVYYQTGDRVIKDVKFFPLEKATREKLQKIKTDYGELNFWLGSYVTPTVFLRKEKNRKFTLSLEQPYIEGVSIQEALTLAQKNNMNTIYIRDFFSKSLQMYKETGNIPDVFGRPHFTGWYNPLTTPNVVVMVSGKTLLPKLVDVVFARLSSNKITQKIHNELLARAIEKTLNNNF